MKTILNYLDHPITANVQHGLGSDTLRAGMDVYLARCDQATFNLVTLLDPSMHSYSIRMIEYGRDTSSLRPRLDPLFRAAYYMMGVKVSPEHTLGDALLVLKPAKAVELLRTHPYFKQDRLMGQESMQRLLHSPVMDKSAELANQQSTPIFAQE